MRMTSNKCLATNIRTLRQKHGWSQEDFADRCGLHRTYVGAIERGERNVTLNTLDSIADAFGISAAQLLDGSVHG